MRLLKQVVSIVAVYSSIQLSEAASQNHCKAVPGEHGWPSTKSWESLNKTVGGRLIAPTPVFAVCHTDRPEYNKRTCRVVKQKSDSSAFLAEQPLGINYNDPGCLPNSKSPCNDEHYPVYVVNATCAADVKHGVDFAREHNVRLVVKGTGHDYNIRSTARHSLSIWTRNMQDFQVHKNFQPSGCNNCDAYPAVTVGAGYEWAQLIYDLDKYDRIVVGGADPTVGLGGFLSAGGHSPISRIYGLGADNILEMEVVTAAGEILTINQKKHSDLFWAVRGGGPSHAVVTSFTLKTYPTPKMGQILWNINCSTPAAYWDVLTYFHTQLPSISDKGLMGYYFPINLGPGGGMMYGTWYGPNKTSEEMNKILSNLEAYVEKKPKTKIVSEFLHFKNFAEYTATVEPETVGAFGRLGSRLIGKEPLTRNTTLLREALMKANVPEQSFVGHLIAGKGVANADIPGGSDSVLPAWRRAYVHIVAVATWKPFDQKLKHKIWDDLTNVRVKALADLDPEAGSYVNEGDPHEPEWQKTFWGSNYPRLLEIKEKWDPHGVFYCFPCVGAELWKHANGTLCKATEAY